MNEITQKTDARCPVCGQQVMQVAQRTSTNRMTDRDEWELVDDRCSSGNDHLPAGYTLPEGTVVRSFPRGG